MSLDLSTIKFSVETTELDTAVKKIETLGKSVEGLATSLGKLDKSTAQANKTQAQANLTNAKAEKELAKAIDITEKATEKLTKATREKQSVEERQAAITRLMAEGNSRGQASILATAEALGEATEKTNEYLKAQRAMSSNNPFDRSLGAATVFANELKVATVASDLYNKDLGFTKNQLQELGREHVRLTEQFKVQGKSLSGVDAEFNKIVQSAQQVTQAENAMAAAMRNADKATVDAGKANAYIESELQKVRFALQANNEELNRGTSNSLVRFENALKKSGLTLDQQKVKIDEYRKAQVELQKTTSSNQTDYITRAVGPQITDIVVGLSTGQSPLTVMMQQGGQLRDQFGMMGIAAKDMGDVMRNAMKGMARSVFDTGKAITTMLAGGMFDAGKAVVNYVSSFLFVDKAIEKTRQGIIGMSSDFDTAADNLAKFDRIAGNFGKVFAFGILAIITTLAAVGVAAVQNVNLMNELSQTLVSVGASYGLTSGQVLEYSNAISTAGISTQGSIAAMTLMIKAGAGTAESLKEITLAAMELEKAGGPSVEKISKMYSDLEKDPIKALSELRLNTGLVTDENIKNIESLIEQGDEIRSVEEATRILTEANRTMALQLIADMNPLQVLWMDMKGALSDLWNGVNDLATSSGVVVAFRVVWESVALVIKQVAGSIKGLATGIVAIMSGDFKTAATIFSETWSDLGTNYAKAIENTSKTMEGNNALQSEAVKNAQKQVEAEKERLALTKVMKDVKDKDDKLNAKSLTQSQFINKMVEEKNKVLVKGTQLEGENLAMVQRVAKAEWEALQPKAKKAKLSDEQKKENKALEDYIDTMNKAYGINKDYNNQLAGFQLLRKNGKITEEDYVKVVEDLIKQQKFYTDGLAQEEKQLKLVQKAWADTNKEQEKKDNEYIKAYDTLKAETLELKNVTSEIQFQFGLLGKTEEQQKLITREHKQQNDLGKVRVELEKELQKIREAGLDPDLEIIARENAAEKIKAINAGVTLQFAQDMQKEFDAIKSSITDSIVTALFDGGKAGSKKLRDALVSALRNKVTLYVDAVVNTALSGGMNAMGFGGGTAGTSGSSSGFNFLSPNSISEGFSRFAGSSFGGSLGLSTPGIDTLGDGLTGPAQLTGLGTQVQSLASSAGSILSYASALNSLSEGKIGTAAGTALGQYFGGPIGAFIGGKIGSAIDEAFAGETRSGASYTSTNGKAVFEKGPSGGEIAGYQSRLMLENAQKAITETLKTVGSKASLTGFVAGLESSDKNKGFSYAGGQVGGKSFGEALGRDGGQFDMVSQDAQTAFANYGKQLSQSILEALQVTEDIPTSLKAMFEGIDISALTSEETDALLKTVNDLVNTVSQFNEAMLELPFEYLMNLSFDTAAGLIAAAGGMAKFGSNLSGFYDNFYTETEKTAYLTTTTSKAFAKLNITMPAINESTREWYRSEVEKLGVMDLSVDANARAYASILGLQGAVNQLAPAFVEVEGAVTEISEVTKGLQSEGASLQSQWDKLFLSEEQYRTKQIQGLTDLEVQQYDTNAAIKKSIDSFDDLKNAAIAAAAALEVQVKLMSEVSGSYNALLELQLTLAKNAAQQSYNLLVRSVEQEKKVLTDAYDARVKELTDIQDEYVQSTSTSLDTLSKSVDNLRSLSEKLKSTLDGMNVSGSEGTQRRLAQHLIREVLGTARNTGALPTDTRILENALSTVSEPSEDLFASFTDYARDFYKTKNDISALSEITDAGLTEQEKLLESLTTQTKVIKDGFDKQLRALKAQYDLDVKPLDDALVTAKAQLDVLNDIDNSVTSVALALSQFGTSLVSALGTKTTVQTEQKTQEQVALDAVKALTVNQKEAVVNQATNLANQLGISPEEALYSYAKSQGITPEQLDKIMGFPSGSTKDWAISKGYLEATNTPTAPISTAPPTSPVTTDVSGGQTTTVISDYQKRIDAGPSYDPVDAASITAQAIAGGIAQGISAELYLYNYAKAAGYNAGMLDKRMGWPIGNTNNWALANGLPTFAGGGMYGGGLALVGEEGPELINFSNPGQVYTAPQTQNLLGGGDNSRMELLLVNLNENITGLRYEIRADVSHNSNISKILNRVSPDGQSLAVSFIEPQDVNVV